MSGHYYYNVNNYPPPPPPPRSDWNVPPPPVVATPYMYESSYSSAPQGYLGSNQSQRRSYFNQGPRVNKNSRNNYPRSRYSSGSYGSGSSSSSSRHHQSTWNRNSSYGNKRVADGVAEKVRPKKKKKKAAQPLSKQKWTTEEALAALNLEKDYHKRFKNQSLIIKFPDLELNKEIVSQFHPSIENVHFQQPSTPRFCFVRLKDSADPDSVISALNQVKFGDGFLKVEYKRDKEDQQNIGPEDIDPLTLYVGNLSKDITKEDVVKAYPKYKRIDIGFAQKMRFTRYAFVSFGNCADSMEAYRNTYSTQMYSKSLIVRFKRVHGSVGMPGDAKPQGHQQDEPNDANRDAQSASTSVSDERVNLSDVKHEPLSSDDESRHHEIEHPFNGLPASDSVNENGTFNGVQIKEEDIKKEESDVEDEEEEEYIEHTYYNNSESDEDEELGNTAENFTSMYQRMLEHVNNISSLNKDE